MLGKFTFTKHHAGGLCQADFQNAARDGKLDQMLGGLTVNQEAHAISNRLFDNLASYMMKQVMSGPIIDTPYGDGSGNEQAALGTILLMVTDSLPVYTESTNEGFFDIHNPLDSANTSTAGKRFVEDQIVPFVIATDPGSLSREAISFTCKWLYGPAEGNSPEIRSIGIFYSSDADQNVTPISLGRIGRIRLHDGNFFNIIIHKRSDEVLLVEYTFTLVSN